MRHATLDYNPGTAMDQLLEATRRAEDNHFWFRGFRRFIRPLVAEAVSSVNSPRILDCGCGTGANLRLLEEYGHSFGFDFTWRGLQFAREYGLRRIAHASITDIPFQGSTFDLVTAFDVLQVLPEEAETAAIVETRRVLRTGGTLIVNVAALEMLKGNHAVLGGEVTRSTRRRLHGVLTRGGYDVQRLTYTNFTLFPLMLAVRTAQRMMGVAAPHQADGDMSVPPAPVNAVLSALVALEARALRYANMPIGSSLLCVARKR